MSAVSPPPVPSGIKSVQRGVASMASGTVDTTITSVTTSKAYCNFLGSRNGTIDGGVWNQVLLLNATTLRSINSGGTVGAQVSWEVVEWN